MHSCLLYFFLRILKNNYPGGQCNEIYFWWLSCQCIVSIFYKWLCIYFIISIKPQSFLLHNKLHELIKWLGWGWGQWRHFHCVTALALIFRCIQKHPPPPASCFRAIQQFLFSWTRSKFLTHLRVTMFLLFRLTSWKL